MKNSIFLCVVTFLIQIRVNAQNQGNIWYFNAGMGVNFNQSCDIVDLSSDLFGGEGTVSISDEDGNLLFYTNGGRSILLPEITGTIWNRNHEVMYDMGITEGGGTSARQSSLAIPKPGDPNHYYLFTMDENEAEFEGTFRGFSYYEIDMELDQGLGGVVDYQESVSSFSFNESIAAVLRPDGDSYWVIIAGLGGIQYYLVDQNGVNLDHVQPSIPITSFGPYAFSPNGKYVTFGGNVASFDTQTGMYFDPVSFLNVGLQPVGSAFSPNSKYFYATQLFDNKVFRVDLEAEDIQSSIAELPTNLSDTEQCGHLLPAPDGNMYFVHSDGVNSPEQLSFSAILCPNSENPCVKENIYTFQGNNNNVAPGLPSFTDHYFSSEVVENGLPVCTNQSATEICDGDLVTLSINHYLADTYQWSTGETTDSIEVTSAGTYTVTVSDGCCNTVEETFEVLSSTDGPLELEINGETVLCNDELTTLTASSELATTYEWSTGSTEASIVIAEAGVYSVSVSDVCDNVLSSQVEVITEETNSLNLNVEGDINCGGKIIASVETNSSNIFWSTGETSSEITIETPGLFSVQIVNSCGIRTDEISIPEPEKIVDIPNVFTPDGDGTNDIFRPIWGCDNIRNFDLNIFNRWGNLVYQSVEPLGGWDGYFNGKPAAADVYIYTLNFEIGENNRLENAGDLTLLR